MTPITAKQIPEEQRIFHDAWEILKEFYGLSGEWENTDGWDKLILRVDEITSRCAADPLLERFARGVVLFVMEYLKMLSKRKRDTTREACIGAHLLSERCEH